MNSMFLINTVNSIKAASYSLEKSYRYNLVLELLPDTLTCAVYDKEDKAFIALDQYVFNASVSADKYLDTLRSMLEEAGLIGPSFHNVLVLWYSPVNTILPDALFAPSQLDTYLGYISTVEDGSICLSDKMRSAHAHMVYAMPQVVKQYLETSFTGVRIRHWLSAFTEVAAMQYKRKDKEKTVIVSVEHAFIAVLVVEGKHLLYANTFKFSSADDVLYYLLFVYEHLDLNPEKNPLQLYGQIAHKDAMHALLFNYFRHIALGDSPRAYELCGELQQLPPHSYFTVFNALLCE